MPMPHPPNGLAEYILRRMQELGRPGKPLSGNEVARRSRDKVSAFHVNNLINGTANPAGISDRVAEGLAIALETSTDKIYEVARIPRPMSRWLLPEKFDRLPDPKRRLVEDLIEAMLHAYDQGRDGVRWGGPTSGPGRSRSSRKVR